MGNSTVLARDDDRLATCLVVVDTTTGVPAALTAVLNIVKGRR